ncbi:DUF1292 domain-containing protein [Melghirimyces algeriensis]|uniref:DUF1292 domain-containing protein n=1 Tax=Melghirimyces algeriensis TaxID=910412 RepID=A0A521CUZ3_9BACL|nr:DUF1292 domain-containing protein [Melghirimyces algeriensis]SMO63245.1 Protein of unknown function [Melghirimyces algeriensis]
MRLEFQEERLTKKLNILEHKLGQELTLVDEEKMDQEFKYQILKELEVDGRHYAILGESEGNDPDAYIFRVMNHGDDDHRLEHVVDDMEWDQVADALDEMIYFDD